VGWDVAVSPDGTRIVVTGSSHRSPLLLDIVTLVYDSATGDLLWVARYGLPDGFNQAYSASFSPDSARVYVAGYAGPYLSADFVTISYDAVTGAQVWAARYDGPGHGGDGVAAMQASPDGQELYVTGFSDGSGTREDYATIAYNAATGHQDWVARYDGPAESIDMPTSLGLSPSGDAVNVTGSSGTYDGTDYLTAAYDARTGSELWTARFGGRPPGEDIATGLVVSPDGRTIYVTGGSYFSRKSGFDWVTIAYGSRTGARVWVARYNGPDDDADVAWTLGISLDGRRIYVAGGAIVRDQSRVVLISYRA